MKRRRWDSKTKTKIVLEGLSGRPVSEICNEFQSSMKELKREGATPSAPEYSVSLIKSTDPKHDSASWVLGGSAHSRNGTIELSIAARP